MAKKSKTEEAPVEGEEKPGGGKKKLLLIVLPLLLAGGGAAYFFLGMSGDEAPTDTTIAPVVEGEVVPVDTMTVNLPDDHYAKVGFALVLDSMADPASIEPKLPIVKDAALSILTRFDAQELSTSDGMERLRDELSDFTSKEFDGDVLRVVLTELLVQ